MDRVAVFVDAGYLFAQGSFLIAGTKLKRSETTLEEQKILEYLRNASATISGLPLLRIYWYDGTDSAPTPVHNSLAFRPDVKVRLGIVNAYGEQKGVDSLIVSDLIDLSRNGAMCDAVLLTGDEDIRVGVQKAQEFGVRVHLIGIEPANQNQSKLLRQEADSLHEITKAELQAFLLLAQQNQQNTMPAVPPVPPNADPLEHAAKYISDSLSPAEKANIVAHPHGIPQDIDRRLLRAGSTSCGSKSLSEDEKRDLRRHLTNFCKT